MPVEQPESDLGAAITRRLRIRAADLVSWRILRKSLDARRRDRLEFVYSAVADLVDEARALQRFASGGDVAAYQPEPFYDPPAGVRPLAHRPIVVGSGPAGLAAGYYLAMKGYRPLIIERGQSVKDRVPAIRAFDHGGDFQSENNYLFGEGGAGCFSDGKLTCRLGGPDVDWVLRRFVECGGRPSLVYEHRPHLGSNKLPLVCRNFRRRIEAMGGEYRFGCRLERIDIAGDCVRGIATSGGYLAASQVVLAIGHSARDTYRMLFDAGVPLERKAFQLGLRIEHPQQQINQFKYGRASYLPLLGAADYTLAVRAGGHRDVYTFCMCAGGIVIPSISEPERFCSNGMSNSRHGSPFANSGLVATLLPEEFGGDHPLAGLQLQRRYESVAFELGGRDYLAPIQPADDFLADRPADPGVRLPSSYRRGTRPANLSGVLPPAIAAAIRAALPVMDRKWGGRYLRNATLVGPEIRGSSPVRIVRDDATGQSPRLKGLYPVGEGAGYAGGIVSAAVDGLRAARKLVEAFGPPIS